MSPNIDQMLAVVQDDYDEIYRLTEALHEALTDLDNHVSAARTTVVRARAAVGGGR